MAARSRKSAARQAPLRQGRPLIALVGRPNVGKSSLFNRLVGQPTAIVEDRPGVTRDRHYADANIAGREVVVIDTGGFDPQSADPMRAGMARHVKLALSEADVVVCVLDASQPPLPADYEAIKLIRTHERSALFVANKCDTAAAGRELAELYQLGIDQFLPVSALHGTGMHDLEAELATHLPAAQKPIAFDETALPYVAIIGRPNAGKSSLVNRLLGREQQLVDSRPGTTVDPIDTLVERRGHRFVLVDTAGIRRKRAVEDPVEAASVMQAIRALDRCNIAVLVVDASTGVAQQDMRLLTLAEERGCAIVIALNKIDLLDDKQRKLSRRTHRQELDFIAWAPQLELSAKQGTGTFKLLTTLSRVHREYHKRIATGELNRFFEDVIAHHPPPTAAGKPVKLYYITQFKSAPPGFAIFSNRPANVQTSYRRYVINQLRNRFGFEGAPVRVHYRVKK